MELFGGAKEFGASFLTGAGDDVGMKTEDIFLYTLIPFGQLFMRMYKFGGSMDKPYLLLLMGPSFPFISTLLNPFDPDFGRNMIRYTMLMWILGCVAPILGYFKLINKVEGGNILDPVIIMPIGIRIIIIALLIYYNYEDEYKEIIIHLALFLIMMLTNFTHLMIRPQCNSSNNSNYGMRFLKVLMDSFFQYGIIFIILGMFAKSKQFAMELYDKPIPFFNNIGEITETLVWIMGAMFGYILTNMFDANYNTDNSKGHINDDVCRGELSSLRYVSSVVLLIVGMVYYIWQNRMF
jgi:hypothetical protein